MDINLYSDYLNTAVSTGSEVSGTTSKDYSNAKYTELMDA